VIEVVAVAVMVFDPGVSATSVEKPPSAACATAAPLMVSDTAFASDTAHHQDESSDSCWMPSDQTYWEPVNTVVNRPDQTITFNAWLGALRPPYGSGQQIPVFKSWGAPRLDPASCGSAFYSHTHNVLLPTTTFMQLRRQLLSAYRAALHRLHRRPPSPAN
jgi:hypothetical protein